MATLAETVTRICDDLSRPESEIGIVVEREVVSAIQHFASRRLRFNEIELAFTVSATTDYSLATIAAANASITATGELIGILGVSEPLKLRRDSHEWEVPIVTYGEWRRRDLAAGNPGWPEIACVFGSTVKIHPLPNVSGTCFLQAHVEFNPRPTGADSPWLTEADRLIRAHAMAAVAATKLMDMEVAQVQQAIAAAALAELEMKSALQLATGETRHWLI